MTACIGRRRRRGRLLPVCPTCLRVSLLQHESDGAGWPGGRSRAAPAWRNAAFVWVSPTLVLPGVTSPAWCFWVSSSTRLMGDGATLLSHRSTAGWHRAGAGPELPASLPDLQHPWQGCRERCQVLPAPCCSSPGLAPCAAFLSPLPSGVPDPTSNPGRCPWRWQELPSCRRPLPGMWAAPEQGSPGRSISVCSHPSRAASPSGLASTGSRDVCVCVCVHAYVCLVLWKTKNPRAAGGR